MRERLDALTRDSDRLAELTELAMGAAKDTTDSSCWPTDIQELADKIQHQGVIYSKRHSVNAGNLYPGEELVRDRDRQIVLKVLPPSVEVQCCDPTYS